MDDLTNRQREILNFICEEIQKKVPPIRSGDWRGGRPKFQFHGARTFGKITRTGLHQTGSYQTKDHRGTTTDNGE